MGKQIESLKEACETVLKREAEAKANADDYRGKLMELNETLSKTRYEAQSYKAMNEDLESDVMKLKAKLYDFMTREVK